MIRRVLAVVGLVLFLGAFAWLAGQAFHPDRTRLEIRPGQLDRAGLLEPAAEPGP